MFCSPCPLRWLLELPWRLIAPPRYIYVTIIDFLIDGSTALCLQKSRLLLTYSRHASCRCLWCLLCEEWEWTVGWGRQARALGELCGGMVLTGCDAFEDLIQRHLQRGSGLDRLTPPAWPLLGSSAGPHVLQLCWWLFKPPPPQFQISSNLLFNKAGEDG